MRLATPNLGVFGPTLWFLILSIDLSAQTADLPPAPEFPKVQAPVLMFHGLDDRALNSDALSGTWKWVAKDLTIVTIPGAGHFVQQDAPEMVTSTMKSWLSTRAR